MGLRYNFYLTFNKILQWKKEKGMGVIFTNIGEKSFSSIRTIHLAETRYFHLENISVKVVFYLVSLHKQTKYIKILSGFKVLKMTLKSSGIFNPLWESQELTIFLCIWKRNFYNKPIVRLSEHGAHTNLGTTFS